MSRTVMDYDTKTRLKTDPRLIRLYHKVYEKMLKHGYVERTELNELFNTSNAENYLRAMEQTQYNGGDLMLFYTDTIKVKKLRGGGSKNGKKRDKKMKLVPVKVIKPFLPWDESKW